MIGIKKRERGTQRVKRRETGKSGEQGVQELGEGSRSEDKICDETSGKDNTTKGSADIET